MREQISNFPTDNRHDVLWHCSHTSCLSKGNNAPLFLPGDTHSIVVTMLLLSLSVLHSPPTQIECNKSAPVPLGACSNALWGIYEKAQAEVDKAV